MLERLKSLLVDEAKQWHRLWSVRFALMSTVSETAYQVLPLLAPAMDPKPLAIIAVLCGVMGIVARLVKQPKLRGE